MPIKGAVWRIGVIVLLLLSIATVRKFVHLGAVEKNNMKGKNFDLDKYYIK
ncbi:hypothetical protein MIDIC_370004 [Alphaproteobacteria bacterium]